MGLEWMFVVMAGGDFEGENSSYDSLVEALTERKHMALTIVGIVLDGDSTLFNRLSTDFPSRTRSVVKVLSLERPTQVWPQSKALKLM